MTATTEPRPLAWLCELMQEDGSVRQQIVTENPDGIRWNDSGEPSPFRVTPLYAESTRSADMSKSGAAIDAQAPQAAPVALTPLTAKQVDELIHTKHFDRSYQKTRSDEALLAWYRMGLRDGERAHGIGAAAQGGERCTR